MSAAVIKEFYCLVLAGISQTGFYPTGEPPLRNVIVVCFFSVSLGCLAGFAGVWYSDARTNPLLRLFVFWPIFWAVAFVVFIISCFLVPGLMGG